MKDLRFHVMMCKTREGVLSSESEDGDTVFLCLHQSYTESKKDKKTYISVNSVEEEQVHFDSAPLHVPCLTPSIP